MQFKTFSISRNFVLAYIGGCVVQGKEKEKEDEGKERGEREKRGGRGTGRGGRERNLTS